MHYSLSTNLKARKTISALKCAISACFADSPICNLDLKIGNSIIGDEILGASDLKDVLEEAQVSITNAFCVFAFHLV